MILIITYQLNIKSKTDLNLNSTEGSLNLGTLDHSGDINVGTNQNDRIINIGNNSNNTKINLSAGNLVDVTAPKVDLNASNEVNVSNKLIVGGNLVVNGNITTVNSMIVTIEDPVLTLGGENDATEQI